MHRGRFLTLVLVVLSSIELTCALPVQPASGPENGVEEKTEVVDDVKTEVVNGVKSEVVDGIDPEVVDEVKTEVTENVKTDTDGEMKQAGGDGEVKATQATDIAVTETEPVDIKESPVVGVTESDIIVGATESEAHGVTEGVPVSDVKENEPIQGAGDSAVGVTTSDDDVTEIKAIDVTESPAVDVTDATEIPVDDVTEIPVEDATEIPVDDVTEIPVNDVTEFPVNDVTEFPVDDATETAAGDVTDNVSVYVTESPAADITENAVVTTESEVVGVTESETTSAADFGIVGVTESEAIALDGSEASSVVASTTGMESVTTPALEEADTTEREGFTTPIIEPLVGAIKGLPVEKENASKTDSPQLTSVDDSTTPISPPISFTDNNISNSTGLSPEPSIEGVFTQEVSTSPNFQDIPSMLNSTMGNSANTSASPSNESTDIVADDGHKPLLLAVKSQDSRNETTDYPNAQQTTPPPASTTAAAASLQSNESLILFAPVNFTETEVFEVKREEVDGTYEESSALLKEADAPQEAIVEIMNVTAPPVVLSNQTEKIPFLLDLEKADKEHDDDGSGEVDKDENDHDKDHHNHHHHYHDDDDQHHGAQHGDSPEDRENKKRTAIIVGVAVGGVALFTLAFFTSRHCRKYSREYKTQHPEGKDTIEFIPLNTTHRGVYDDMEARNPNGLYRQGPKMGPPSPRMHRKSEGKFEFPEIHGKSGPRLDVPKKTQPSGSSHSLPDEPFLTKQVDKIKYMDESTDDELDDSPRERLLPSNGQSPDSSQQKSPIPPEIRIETVTSSPNGLESPDGVVA